jgi:ketosteroid isomerase-like protein
MYRSVITLALALGLTSAAAASEETEVMSVVQQWVGALHKGDKKAFVALCDDQSTIIDDFPPYEWQGSGACSAWWTDYEVLAKKYGMSDSSVVLGKPLQIYVNGDHAYVVTRDQFTFQMDGKAMKQSNAIHTIVLKRKNSGWHITGEAWSAISLAAPVNAEP